MAFPTFVKTLIQIPQRHRSRLPRNRRNHHFRRRPRHRHRHPLSLGADYFSSFSSDAVSRVAASPPFAPHPLFLSISISVSPMISRIAITLAVDCELRMRVPFRRIRAIGESIFPVRSRVSYITVHFGKIADRVCHSTIVRTKFRVLRVLAKTNLSMRASPDRL